MLTQILSRCLISLLVAGTLALGGCSGNSAAGGMSGGSGAPGEQLPAESEAPPGSEFGATPPIAQPSPPIIDAVGQLHLGNLEVMGNVSREGATVAGVVVTVTNATTGETQTAVVGEDGNFTITVVAAAGDLIFVQATDPDTGQTSNLLEAVVPDGGGGVEIDIPFVDPFDFDGDGFKDDVDACPLDPAGHIDTDGDGSCDPSDPDDDGDGVPDTTDPFSLDLNEWLDTDSDGTGNNADVDDDGDSVADGGDCAPLQMSVHTDVTQYLDNDRDGVRESSSAATACTNGAAQYGYTLNATGTDNCPTVSTPNQADADGDGDGDACDADLDWDGDGLNNAEEAALGTDPNKTDTDGDGVSDPDEVAQGRNPAVNEAALIVIIQTLLLDD